MNLRCVLALVLTCLLCSFNQAALAQGRSDANDSIPRPYPEAYNFAYDKVETESRYLRMRDDVRIAVDIHLPKGRPADAKLPTLMWQTRYWRSVDLSWPFEWFMSEHFIGRRGKMFRRFVRAGYAVVVVDTRGTGASFDTAEMPFHEDEIRDGYDIAEWITQQPWSSGKIGAVGVSYSGVTADFLATNGHPAVKAVATLFSMYDVFDDVTFPGGIYDSWFTRQWGELNRSLDLNIMPKEGFMRDIVVRGVLPVDGPEGKRLMKQAVAKHRDNYDVRRIGDSTHFRDDTPAEIKGYSMDQLSPHTHSEKAKRSDVAFYSWSGYYDGAYPHSAIKRHLTLNRPQNKLILGPWEHGGEFNGSPYAPGESAFDQFGEVVKFFDFHLKGRQNGLDEEPPIHYYTIQEGEWKSAERWPPPAERRKLYLAADSSLRWQAPLPGHLVYEVDTTHGTGDNSRWSMRLYNDPTKAYDDRAEKDKKLLVLETPPLNEATEITGHALLQLKLRSDKPYGNVFAYLEEVAPDGSVRYITEGQLKLEHRKVLSADARPYTDAPTVPFHSYRREDAQPVQPGLSMDARFDFYPVSYEVPAGHRIRLAIAGADRDYFQVKRREPPVYTITSGRASFLELPIVPD